MQSGNKKINVLLVNDHIGWHGTVMHGVGGLFLQWMPAFDQDKFRVMLCILRKKDALSEMFQNRGIKIKHIGKGKYNPLTLSSLIKIIRDEKIDLMHVQGFGGTTFGRLAKILTGVPVIVHFHDTSSYYPLAQRLSDALLARFTDTAVAVSNKVKNFNIENGRLRGLKEDKVLVMHNCVSIEDFKMPDAGQVIMERNRLGIDPEAKIVGTVTRLYESKGNRYLLEAAVKILNVFPECTFLLVGDGPLRKDLEQLAKRLGIEKNTLFTGFHQDAKKILATFDVKVFTSWGEEGTPLTVLEAMAMGKPIVATNIIEIIEHEITGLVVPPKDPEALAEKVIFLLNNQNCAKKLGTNAQRESRGYDVNVYVRRLEALYDETISKTRNQIQNSP